MRTSTDDRRHPAIRHLIWATLAAFALCACDPGPSPNELQAMKAKRAEAAAQEQAENFHKLKKVGRPDLALDLAEDLLRKYPDSQAAASIKPELETLRTEIHAMREEVRLKSLWSYFDDEVKDAGGKMQSAYMFAKAPIAEAEPGKQAPRARLVLRKHPQWGDSVYLLSERGPFVCPDPCKVTVHFDGETRVVPGEIPSTGEHAIFVEDFAYFATHLADAKLVSFDVELRDLGAKTLEFEVGGYDPATIGTP